MREIIGQMTIAELVQNRDKFAQESIRAAMSDMGNMGLEIINLTIQNFSDKDGQVIETMAIQNVVEKERDAAIARAKAQQEGHKAEMEARLPLPNRISSWHSFRLDIRLKRIRKKRRRMKRIGLNRNACARRLKPNALQLK